MLARCLSASLQGLEVRPVVVEVDLASGLPGVQLVGLPDKAIQESQERVRSALRNSGFRGPLVRRRAGARRQPQALSRGDCPRRKGPAAAISSPGVSC